MSEVDITKPREKTEDIVHKLLAERQEMLVSFCRIAGLEAPKVDKPDREMIENFCQILVDYSAFGHFEIYSRILSGEERRKEVVEVANQIYPQIVEATEFAVAFNDKYDQLTHTEPLDHLAEDLSKLGEEIAMRIEFEDRLLDAMMTS